MDYINNKYYKSDITGKIIGCAQKVHRFLGAGFQEKIYQRALKIELSKLCLNFEREKEMDIFYEDILIGNRRVDFLVDGDIMVELPWITKCIQIIKYCLNYHPRASGDPVFIALIWIPAAAGMTQRTFCNSR